MSINLENKMAANGGVRKAAHIPTFDAFRKTGSRP